MGTLGIINLDLVKNNKGIAKTGDYEFTISFEDVDLVVNTSYSTHEKTDTGGSYEGYDYETIKSTVVRNLYIEEVFLVTENDTTKVLISGEVAEYLYREIEDIIRGR